MLSRVAFFSLVLFGSLAGSSFASASPVVTTPTPGVTVYTSAAAFAAATTGPSTIGFDGIIVPPAMFAGFPSLSLGGATFSDGDPAVDVNVTAAGFYGPSITYPADFLVDAGNTDPANTLNITFASGQAAVGLDFGALFSSVTSTLTASTGTAVTDTATASAGSTEFVGFVSTTPITSLSLTVTGDSYVLEDVVLASPVPEPTTWAMLILAMGGLGAALRRRGRFVSV
jgi:hypothetical protein